MIPRRYYPWRRIKKYKGWYAVVFSLALLVLLAWLFGMYDQGYSVAEGLLFAITGMATGGLVAPDGNSPFAMWVTGWYVLVHILRPGTHFQK